MGLRDLIKRRAGDSAADHTAADFSAAVHDPTEGDRLVLEQLKDAGADLAQKREVRHYLYVPSREAADALAAIVRNEGHEAEVSQAAEHDAIRPWRVTATSHAVVTDEGVAAARRRFQEFAAEYGGHYDGWEAAV